MRTSNFICNLGLSLRLLWPLFASLCLLSPASALGSSIPPEKECEIATTQPFKPVQVGGLNDSEFIARMVFELDEFWAKRFTKDFTRQLLGVTDAVLESYARGESIRMPRDWWHKKLKVVIYDGTIDTILGPAKASDSPFYLTGNRTLYISDHSLRSYLNGKMTSDADWAFLMAHEYAHHMQEHIGLARFLTGAAPFYKNHLTMRMELQADCLAGYWIGHNRSRFTNRELVSMFEFVGKLGGEQHGDGKQRLNWLLTGMGARSIKECDTFTVKAERL